MSEKFSRTIVFIEAILFLAPLALLSIVGFATVARNAHFVAPLIIFGAVQILAWNVVIKFVIGGRETLRDFSLTMLIIFVVSAFSVLFAMSMSSSGSFGYAEIGDGPRAYIDVAVWGFPALIPFVHLMLERHFYFIRIKNETQDS